MASSCFLHVGQCGVQLGRSFWDTVLEWDREYEKKTTAVHKLRSSVLPFSLHNGVLPCVVVDSEPKPANSCFGHGNSPHNLMSDAILTDWTGRGNNWACGYSERQKQSNKSGDGMMVERVRDAVRRVAEQCDCFMGLVIFHSIAGGTGSGLTSRLVEQLREDYPNQYILCVSVAPFQSGETPMQHYNSLLCLHWLQSYCDCIMLVQNDAILHQTTAQQHIAAMSRKINDVSFNDMNHLINNCICNCFIPLNGLTTKRFSHPVVMEPWELSRSLCPDPLLKFVTPSHITTKPSTAWDTTLSHLLQDVKLQRKDTKTQSIVLIGRGSPSAIDSLIGNLKTVEKRIKNAYNTVDWNPFPVDSWLSRESLSTTKRLSLLANSSRVNSFLDMVCSKSRLMYSHNAYWHWYEQYGLERETFEQAYDGVRTVIDNYSQLNE